MKPLIIAIDGPSGAGKGTVARSIAAALGYRHLDTGAMYRAVAWKALHSGIPLDDERAVADLARDAELHAIDGVVTINGSDVGQKIRNAEVDRASTIVARLPKVREALVALQKREGARGGIVVEGRDIGTVVFPDADVKIFSTRRPTLARGAAPPIRRMAIASARSRRWRRPWTSAIDWTAPGRPHPFTRPTMPC